VYATSRAAGCPDLFAVHAADPTARERVIADLTLAAATERILVLSPDAQGADRIAERVVKSDVTIIRALAEDENPTRPSSLVSKATSTAVLAARAERLKRTAATAVADATARLATFDTAGSSATQLATLRERLTGLEVQLAEANAQRAAVEGQVQREAAGTEVTQFTMRVDLRKAECQGAVEGIRQQQLSALAARQDKEAVVSGLQRLATEATAEAAKKTGFLSRLLHRPKPGAGSPGLEKQLHDAERELEEAAGRVAVLQRDLDIMAAKVQDEREQLIRAEITVRQSQLASQVEHLTAECVRVQTELDSAKRPLGPGCAGETELVLARQAAEGELAAARQRAADLERAAGEPAKRVFDEARVVVGTPGSLASDPVFARDEPSRDLEPRFGLLVLDWAEELTEHDFVRLAKLARRWVLVGNLTPPEEPRSNGKPVNPRGGSGHARNGRHPELPFAARLAHVLDREPWTTEPDRLVCRLEHLTPEARRGITREPLLDRPEIELRFATTSTGEAVLAEVAFPAATSPAAAKAFLYCQLGAILVRPCGNAVWLNSPEEITVTWPAADRSTPAAESSWIDLEPGVREKVAGSGVSAFTAAITFATAAGWDDETARAWLNEHLPTESPSRFAPLPRR
jgi:hypothetical protein